MQAFVLKIEITAIERERERDSEGETEHKKLTITTQTIGSVCDDCHSAGGKLTTIFPPEK